MVDKTTGDNAAPNQQQGDGETPEYLTKEEFNKQLNAAITGRMKSFEKQMETLTAAMTRLAPPQEPEKLEKVSNPEIAEMKKQFELMKKERDDERSKRRDNDLRRQVQEKLVAKGVKPEFVQAVMAKLIDGDKTLGYSEDDQIIFKSQEGELDLDSGLSSWVKSEGKAFLAPKGTSGAGFSSFKGKDTATGESPEQVAVNKLMSGMKGILT